MPDCSSHRSGRASRPARARLTFALALAAGAAAPASAQLRVCQWNVTNYGTTSSTTDRNADFAVSFYGVVPSGLALAGRSMSPDVIIAEEFLSTAAVTAFKNLLNGVPANSGAGGQPPTQASPGDWAAAPFIDGPDTDSAFFYRTGKVVLVGVTTINLGSSSTNDAPRNTYRYDVRLAGYGNVPAVSIGIYATHMKAQGGTNDSGRRLVEALAIRQNAAGLATDGPGLPAGWNYLMGGDTNITTSNVDEYKALVAAGGTTVGSPAVVLPAGGRLYDPINTPGSWNNNSAFRLVHTQEPSTQMDDRHDQLLLSPTLLDGAGIDYVCTGLNTATHVTPAYYTPTSGNTWNDPRHSYRSWGNDGTSFDAPIKTVGNTMVGQTIASALIGSVGSGGGHLPVYLDLRVPARVDSTVALNFGTVFRGQPASLPITVYNSADTALWTAAGIADLSYTLSASPGFTAPGGTFTDAAGGPQPTHAITLDTSTVGVKTGTITILSNAPDAPSRTVTLTATVVEPPPPPCSADWNGDGEVNGNDISDYINAWYGDVTNGTVVADFNDDGETNGNDISEYINAWYAAVTCGGFCC